MLLDSKAQLEAEYGTAVVGPGGISPITFFATIPAVEAEAADVPAWAQIEEHLGELAAAHGISCSAVT